MLISARRGDTRTAAKKYRAGWAPVVRPGLSVWSGQNGLYPTHDQEPYDHVAQFYGDYVPFPADSKYFTNDQSRHPGRHYVVPPMKKGEYKRHEVDLVHSDKDEESPMSDSSPRKNRIKDRVDYPANRVAVAPIGSLVMLIDAMAVAESVREGSTHNAAVILQFETSGVVEDLKTTEAPPAVITLSGPEVRVWST